ncbi:hypothetical protein PF007_g1508 [Phytophthora fragariae]|uniref:Uncharacterized protein n=1 Tax=Phytophthora fragariae TaxID=53985 RepID=A0A6A3TKV0_9STRA|nr:hypothetical protein PF007_g1508 [Phytophthora fragariae]
MAQEDELDMRQDQGVGRAPDQDFVLNMTADEGPGLREVQGTKTDTIDQGTRGKPILLPVDESRRAKRRTDTTDQGTVQENHPPAAGPKAARC